MKITLATKITIARIFLIIPTIIVFIIAQCFRDNYTVYLASLIVSARGSNSFPKSETVPVLRAICPSRKSVEQHTLNNTADTMSDARYTV